MITLYERFCRLFWRKVCFRCGARWCGGPTRVMTERGTSTIVNMVPWKVCRGGFERITKSGYVPYDCPMREKFKC